MLGVNMSTQNQNTTSYTVLLGGLIARLRQERGFDQVSFAQRIHLSQPSLSKIETGQTVLNVIQLRSIAQALGVEQKTILDEVDKIANHMRARGIVIQDHKSDPDIGFFLGAAAVAGIIALLLHE